MEKFNASLDFDRRLYAEDIQGSLAHAGALVQAGILEHKEHAQVTAALKKIKTEFAKNRFHFAPAHEDIHMAIENRLHELIGPLAGKLHTGRSRNDQVALDTRLFVKKEAKNILKKISSLQNTLIKLAKKHQSTVLPGHTHLQPAQPVLLAHHLLAYFEMLERDFDRLSANLKRLDQCPLGAGALAGTTLPVDRLLVAKNIEFTDVTHNSMDAVSDRDFVLDFLYAASVLMMHLSRLCEELVLWSSHGFQFINLPQEFCTGSSLMPQKVNPDACELIRGKTGRVYGNLLALLTVMKALPLAYNKDMQEDKEPLFDTTNTIHLCLDVITALLDKTSFNAKNMRQAVQKGFLLATDLADYLVRKGLPFRQAHQVVGKLVRLAVSQNCGLEDLSFSDLKRHSTLFDRDVTGVLSVERSLNARDVIGGTALNRVKEEIKRAQKMIPKHNEI